MENKFYYQAAYFIFLLFICSCQRDEQVINNDDEADNTNVEWYHIAEEDLYGWDQGFCAEQCYALIKTDTLDKTSIIYINSFENDKSGIIVSLDANSQFYTFIAGDKKTLLCREGNKLYITKMDNEGNFISNSSFNYTEFQSVASRVLPDYTGAEAARVEKLGMIKETLGYLAFGMELAQDMVDRGFWSTIGREMLTLGISSKTKLIIKSKLALKYGLNDHDLDVLGEFLDQAEGVVEDTRNGVIRNLLGNIDTEIEKVYKKRSITGDPVFYVDVRISGINSVPSTWKDFLLRDHINEISCMVVAGAKTVYNDVFPSYYNCQSMSHEFMITRGTNSMRITFPIMGLSDYLVLKFRPLVLSSKERSQDVGAFFQRGEFIRYGTPAIYENKYAYIESCKTKSVNYESNKVQFHGFVDVTNYCEDDEQWGIYYINENGQPIHFEPKHTNLRNSEVYFSATLDELSYDYEKWEATYTEGLGVYYIDGNGNYSYGELKDFDFVYDVRPTIEFLSAEILGTRKVNDAKSRNVMLAAPGGGDENDEDDEEEKCDEYITEFIQIFKVEGSLWIDHLDYVKDEGKPNFESESGKLVRDGTYKTRGSISYNSKLPNVSAITRYAITLRDGTTIDKKYGSYVNRLYWSGEEKITNVEWK